MICLETNFTNDCCGHTCDLLSQYLLEHGIETRQVNGTCRENSEWHHVWEEGTVHKIFCVNRFPEITTIFTESNESMDFGGRQSAYQQRLIEVYEIVHSYL